MEQQSGNSSLRKVRTFADDLLRAQGGGSAGASTLTEATSVVAPTVTARSTAPQPQKSSDGFLGGLLSGDMLDIRNVSAGTEEATIVTERKAKQWSFTDAVTTAVRTWWKDTMQELNRGTHEVPRSVSQQKVRGAIVRSARMDAKVEQKPSVPIQKTNPVAVPAAPTTQSPVVAPAAPSIPVVPPAEASLREPVERAVRPVVRVQAPLAPLPDTTPAPSFRSYSSAPIRVAPAPASPREIDEVLPTNDPREATIREEAARFTARARDAAQKRKDYEASIEPSHRGTTYFVYAVMTLVVILSLVIGAGVARKFLTAHTEIVPPAPGIETLFTVSQSEAVPLLPSHTSLLTDLAGRVHSAQVPSGTFIRYFFVAQGGNSSAELPAHAFFDVLNARAPGSFLRTIEDRMMLGAYGDGDKKTPFMVLKVQSYEDALGGMLLFERTMNNDLAPLFGDDLERAGQVGTFRDEVVGGVDTRSLYDQYGNMVLTYAFIDKHTLVITTSYTTLGALAGVLK